MADTFLSECQGAYGKGETGIQLTLSLACSRERTKPIAHDKSTLLYKAGVEEVANNRQGGSVVHPIHPSGSSILRVTSAQERPRGLQSSRSNLPFQTLHSPPWLKNSPRPVLASRV